MPKENGVEYGIDYNGGNSDGKNVILWGSFDGRVFKDFNEMSHQHLSNIYYWTHVVHPNWYVEDVKNKIRVSIDRRFDGNLLEYRPLACFKKEMEVLQERGWLIEHDDHTTRVVVDGKEIGSVDYNTYPI